MGNKRCRLYDENLVHNIMLSTGLSIFEYLKENPGADSDEVYDFIEANADDIISDTISHLKGMDEHDEKKSDTKDAGAEEIDEWLPPGEEEKL